MVELYCKICNHLKSYHLYHYKDDGKTKKLCLAWCPYSDFISNNLKYLEEYYEKSL